MFIAALCGGAAWRADMIIRPTVRQSDPGSVYTLRLKAILERATGVNMAPHGVKAQLSGRSRNFSS